ANDMGWIVAATELSSKILVLLKQVSVGEKASNLAQDFVEQDRLHQVIMGSALKCFDGIFHGGIGRDQKHKRLRIELEERLEELDTVHSGELDVAERNVEWPVRRSREGLFPVGAGAHLETFLSQVLGERFADQRFVVNDQDLGFRCSRAGHVIR